MTRYKRHEVASRFGVYYTAVAVAGGLSGLIAGVITQYLDGARGIAGWRWLFVRCCLHFHTAESGSMLIACRLSRAPALRSLALSCGSSWAIIPPTRAGLPQKSNF